MIGVIFGRLSDKAIDMKQLRRILLIFALITLLLLSGCVNLLQEINVQEDGSGSILFAIGVDTDIYPQFQASIPDGFALEDLLSSLIQNENISEVTWDQYETNGRTWDSVRLDVTDFISLLEDSRRIGPLIMRVTEEDGEFIFLQTINLDNSNVRIPGVNLLDLSGSSYTVRLLTPQIIDTNGVQESAGVSTWSVPLTELLQDGGTINQRATYVLEPYEGVFIPWEIFYPYVVIGFLSLGFLAILTVILVNTSFKRDKEKKLTF